MDGTACREIDQTIKEGFDLKTTRLLWQKFRKENSETERNRLIEKYLPLVQRIAEKVASKLPNCVDPQDLQSAGIFGLMHAIRGFDMNRGVRFETYCASRIRGAILDELRQIDWVPRLVRTRSNRLDHAQRDLERELGHKPSPTEIAGRMNASVEEIEVMIREARPLNMVSLNAELPENDENKAYRKLDFLEDKQAPDPFENLNKRDLMDLVSKGLSREERLVLLLYYYEQLTMKEIGLVLDVTESRVCQIHTQIIDRLRRKLKRRVEEFVP